MSLFSSATIRNTSFSNPHVRIIYCQFQLYSNTERINWYQSDFLVLQVSELHPWLSSAVIRIADGLHVLSSAYTSREWGESERGSPWKRLILSQVFLLSGLLNAWLSRRFQTSTQTNSIFVTAAVCLRDRRRGRRTSASVTKSFCHWAGILHVIFIRCWHNTFCSSLS